MQDRDQYRLFLHLAQTLSYTRTAADCHVSPATLSRTVQRLEAATGHQLLERGPRGVALTTHGRAFRRYAADALDLWSRYRDGDTTADDLGGHLRVFASVTACHSLLPDLLGPLRTAHPRVHISLRTGDAAAALALLDQDEADLAVAALPARVPATLLAREITHTPLVLVQGRTAPAAEPFSVADEPFVLPRKGLVRTAADQWFRSLGSHPHIAAEADGHEALLTLVALGYGTGVIPGLVLRHSGVRTGLRQLPTPPGLGRLTIGVCIRRADAHRPLVAAAWAATRPGTGPRPGSSEAGAASP
ncbi:HTH-type transcriptional activator IlvY [Streptomyces sp. MP131-18]|uniref:HTH-type transcriptional activator IlvY n=1 Tax=Streptomyces sp. MP131-18 TaxID=1857892 RepID=UPI00097CA249|nr:HTH-type transcriptional activator IlvY [Streptomyces sp. MP131-18]ONK09888.1 Cyn operon transcriptional activator [Streptomyces sp. MP131-18]